MEQETKTRELLYRYLLFAMLGVTRVLSAADYHIPTKWYTILESVRTSSDVLHDRIAGIDEDVEQDFREHEKMIERRLGREKFYSEEEIDELQDRVNEIQI